MKSVEGDLFEVEVDNENSNKARSWAWSCNMVWAFVVQPEGLYLLNVHSKIAWLCRKQSRKFIEIFLERKKPVLQ